MTKRRLIEIGSGILVLAFFGWLIWYGAPRLFR
jgi:TRAP-type C4-dicarboxylate transport system permease small subunit